MFGLFKGKKVQEEERPVLKIIAKYEENGDPLGTTHAFVKEFIGPCPERYDMTYRYEHSLRVAAWGKRIAEGEGWNPEPLQMACLLHDVGYPECKRLEDFDHHPAFSADVAALFLKKIGYDEQLTESICKAIAIHDKWNDVPADATPFELSVRDADDLDRFDAMRICMLGRSDIGEKNTEELLELCAKRLDEVTSARKRICGTATAEGFWQEKCDMRQRFYEELRTQLEGTFKGL